MKKMAEEQIMRNVRHIKWKMRNSDLFTLETIMNEFARSLLIYIGTPMIAAGLWRSEDLDRIEKKIMKKNAMVPNNISP